MNAREALEQRAERDHAAHVGKILLVSSVDGYSGNDSVTVELDPPARMRVDSARREDLHHWVDSWLDPYWDVSTVEPHPALEGIRSMWVYGPSYSVQGETQASSDWTVEPSTIERLKAALARLVAR